MVTVGDDLSRLGRHSPTQWTGLYIKVEKKALALEDAITVFEQAPSRLVGQRNEENQHRQEYQVL